MIWIGGGIEPCYIRPMNALRRSTSVSLAGLIASSLLLSSCAHQKPKPAGDAASNKAAEINQPPTGAPSVTASGTAPLTYQWRFNGTNLADGTNRLPANPAGNPAEKTADEAEHSSPAPTNITATGMAPLTYHWLFNASNAPSVTNEASAPVK